MKVHQVQRRHLEHLDEEIGEVVEVVEKRDYDVLENRVNLALELLDEGDIRGGISKLRGE